MATTAVDTKVSAAIREMMAARKKAKEAEVQPEKEEVAPLKVEVPAVVVADGYVHSSTFGLRDAFAVRVFQTSDWDEQVQRLIPEVDPMFVAPKDELATLLRAWEDGDRTMIYGPTGAGKSSLVRHACALTKRPFIRVNLTRDTDSGQLFGERGIDVSKGDTFKAGPVTEAAKYGAVLLLDEWTLMQAEISMGLQYLMEDGGKLFLKEMPGTAEEKTITPHVQFRLVAGDNTNGQGDETGAFVGTSVQNSATLDRFGTAFKLDYLSAKDEVAMLAHRFPDAPAAALKSFRLCAEQIRKAYEQGNVTLTLSPRGLINVVKKYMQLGDARRAFDLAYINKLRETDARVANALIDKVFPRS